MVSANLPAADGDLKDYFAVLWRRRWTVGLIALGTVVAAVGLTTLQRNSYTAQTQLLLQAPNNTSALASGGSGQSAPVDVPTQVQLVSSAPVQQAVAADLGVSVRSVPSVHVSEVGTTNVVQISASAPVAGDAARIANSYAKAYLAVRAQENSRSFLDAAGSLEGQITSLRRQISALPAGTPPSAAEALNSQISADQTQQSQLQLNAAVTGAVATIVSPAVAPSLPSSPKRKTEALLGLILGLALGAGGALLMEALDDRVRGADGLEAATGRPVLGTIPALPNWKDPAQAHLASFSEPHGPSAEAYRQLRTAVQFANLDSARRILQVTSASQGEGKSTTAANLALTMAQAGIRVALVDADLRRPRQHQFFGFDHRVGLTSVLLGEVSLNSALLSTQIGSLSLLPSGTVPPNPAELLTSGRLGDLLDQLAERFAAIIVDGPPVLPVTDAVVLAARTDAVILVAHADHTHRRALERTMALLGQVGAEVAGVVCNGAAERSISYGYGYGEYQNAHSSPAPDWMKRLVSVHHA